MTSSSARRLLKFVPAQLVLLAVSVALVVFAYLEGEMVDVHLALVVPVLVGLGAVLWRMNQPGPESLGLHLVRFLGALVASVVVWGIVFATLALLVRLTSGTEYDALPIMALGALIAPHLVGTAGLLVLFKLGPGQRQPV